MGGKCRDEFRSEIGKMTMMVADVPITDSLGKMHGAFCECQLEKCSYCWWLVGQRCRSLACQY
jgi:hypothetical protein